MVSGVAVRGPPQSSDQVPDDHDVECQQQRLCDGNVFHQLVDFHRNERAGDDDGEIFGPPFLQQQAGALGQQQGGIEKSAGADFLQLLGVDGVDLYYEAVQVPVLRINPDNIHPTRDDFGDVPVDQGQGSDSDNQQQQALD